MSTHEHDRDPRHPRPRLAGSEPGSDAMPGRGAGPGDLPVVEGGGIHELGEGGLTELEAAAMLAGLDDEPAIGGPAPIVDRRSAGSGEDDLAIPMADAAPTVMPAPVPIAATTSHAAVHESDGVAAPAADPRFRAIGVAAKRHEDDWSRTPNATGTGAIHVRTFMSKLTEDGFHALDERINEWLDAHPQYEVKFVSTSIGTVTGKLKEPHLICQVWV